MVERLDEKPSLTRPSFNISTNIMLTLMHIANSLVRYQFILLFFFTFRGFGWGASVGIR